jgi:hypothetical protein
MFGLEDGWIIAAYVACLASTAICVIYGVICWNRGGEEVAPKDIEWAAEEKKIESEL